MTVQAHIFVPTFNNAMYSQMPPPVDIDQRTISAFECGDVGGSHTRPVHRDAVISIRPLLFRQRSRARFHHEVAATECRQGEERDVSGPMYTRLPISTPLNIHNVDRVIMLLINVRQEPRVCHCIGVVSAWDWQFTWGWLGGRWTDSEARME